MNTNEEYSRNNKELMDLVGSSVKKEARAIQRSEKRKLYFGMFSVIFVAFTIATIANQPNANANQKGNTELNDNVPLGLVHDIITLAKEVDDADVSSALKVAIKDGGGLSFTEYQKFSTYLTGIKRAQNEKKLKFEIEEFVKG